MAAAQKVTRASLVDAARDLNKVLDLSPEIDVKLGVAELRSLVTEASAQVVEGDAISDATRGVIEALTAEPAPPGSGEPDGAAEQAAQDSPQPQAAKAPKAAKTQKAAKTPKAAKVPKAAKAAKEPGMSGSGVNKMRPGSSLHKILLAASDNLTMAAIAERTNLREDQVIHRLRYVIGRRYGIDYNVDESGGAVSLVFKDGKSLADVIATN